ncbi:MAG: alpha/beta fold hydrolase [Geminicoccaceae bacterium]|nr:alpha/beta fold hydrolase [Geminicoccaceae bacterium]
MRAGGTAYDLAGPADAPVLVLIHGLGLTRRTWADHLPALARDRRVLSYDLAGHGESAPPRRTPSLAVLSEQLRALLDALGVDRVALVGFSLGGMINRRFAMDHPDRVSALAVLNSPHERTPEAQRQVEARAAAGGPAATIEETLERWFTPAFRRDRPDAVDRVRSMVLANDPDTYVRHRRVLASGVVELIRPEPPIALPTLVMTCENDAGSTPAMARAIAAEIAGAETIVVPGLRHLGLMERPALFTDPIRGWLDRVLRPETPAGKD